MRFTSFAVLAVLSSTNAFAPPSRNLAFSTSNTLYAVSDLEAKLLSEPEPKKTKSKAARKAKEPAPEPIKKSEPIKNGSYDFGGYDFDDKKKKKTRSSPPPKVDPTPAPVAAERKKAAPKERAPKKSKPVVVTPPPRPAPVVKTTVSDPNAGPVGVALGAAPLLLAPLGALVATRDILSKTAARRAVIEEEIAAAEAAKEKKLVNADVDAGGLATAAVSIHFDIS